MCECVCPFNTAGVERGLFDSVAPIVAEGAGDSGEIGVTNTRQQESADVLASYVAHLRQWPECPLLNKMSLASCAEDVVRLQIRWLVQQGELDRAQEVRYSAAVGWLID